MKFTCEQVARGGLGEPAKREGVECSAPAQISKRGCLMESKPSPVAEFLTHFFHGAEHQVELRALPSKARLFTRDLKEIARFINGHISKENIYFGCATREGRGGTKEHCREIPALWVDLDFKDTTEAEAEKKLADFKLPPSVIVASGGGLHCYWLLRTPVSAQTSQVEPILRGLALTLGGDLAAAETARVLRLPGTLNYKYSPPRKVELAISPVPWERRYLLEDFLPFKDPRTTHAASAPASADGRIAEGQRNTHLTSLAGTMRRPGMSKDAILATLLTENNERCAPPLAESEIRAVAESVSRYEPATEKPAGNADRESAATKLVHLSEGMELFHDAMREGYATVQVNTHRETMRIASRSFRQHLTLQYFQSEGKAPSPQALASALATVEAKALFDGPELGIHTRVAEEHGAIYLDLCNPTWQAVQITEKGWEVVSNPPVKFVRGAGMLPLPMPASGGSFRELERFTTLRGDGLALLKGYMLGILREHVPFPILALIGEQGAGKTTLTRLVKRGIDPAKASVRCLPKDERDLLSAAERAHIIALDNLSHIDEQLSDALCRLATGGGLATRTLFTDRDEIIFDCQRPVILIQSQTCWRGLTCLTGPSS